MKKIAITGSYASGKTYVLSLAEEMNYPVFSSDEYVRNLYKDISFQKSLWKALGEDGEFSKEVIKTRMLEDPVFRKKLEDFIHPLVKEGMKEFVLEFQGDKRGIKNSDSPSKELLPKGLLSKEILFFEVPLLFEAGMPEYFDKIICVYCSEETRKERAMQKISFSKDKFDAIGKIQMPQEKKKQLADYVLNSDQSKEAIKQDLYELIKSHLAMA